jgi:rhodanese-related sulfurtransferase
MERHAGRGQVRLPRSMFMTCGLLLACAHAGAQVATAKSVRDLLAEANAVVVTLTAEEAIGLFGDSQIAFVDLREQSELDASGWIPGAVHAPRGMLEFYIDPSSRMHMREFSSGKRILFYCAGGGRSALAAKTAMEMGLTNVAHVGGGFRAWVQAGGPVERSPSPGQLWLRR